ncbi:hypothetical protein BB559_000989 [Furculomyces boomerangus]|uniref:50S ribosomal protein L35 n=2 Tax=Harpellales TaxID=61421 RepID=A0A2T9YE72_9FUNG|nr:hypothetical protein BB559_004510 [Furculomyces boomerangus]PVU99116.1 hypothetical protein BB559_000989 [Furculomyces boomerangus]PWA02940.1 hypothetical protein BB558_000906 [Smittium angustum]
MIYGIINRFSRVLSLAKPISISSPKLIQSTNYATIRNSFTAPWLKPKDFPKSITNSTTTLQIRNMSKLKTHKGAAKRWKKVGSGLYKRKQCGKQHLNSSMRPSRRRKLGKTVLSNRVQTRILDRILFN